jgi:threonine dehydratase
VSESAIVAAMRFVWERAKIVIQPSAAVPIAVLIAVLCERRINRTGRRIGIIVSGDNVLPSSDRIRFSLPRTEIVAAVAFDHSAEPPTLFRDGRIPR